MSALRFGVSSWRRGNSVKIARGHHPSVTTISSLAITPADSARVSCTLERLDLNDNCPPLKNFSDGCFPGESVFITTAGNTDVLKMKLNNCNGAKNDVGCGRMMALDHRTTGSNKRKENSTNLGFNRNASFLFRAAQPFTKQSRQKVSAAAVKESIIVSNKEGGREVKAAISRTDEELLSPKTALSDGAMVDNARWAHNVRVVLPHVLLYTATIIYSVIGAVVFHRLELPFETEHLNRYSAAIVDAQNALIQLRLADADDVLGWRTSTSIFNESIDNAIDVLIRVSMDAFAEGIKASDLTAMFQTTAAFDGDIDTSAISIATAATVTNFTGHVVTTIRPKWNFHSSLFFTTTLLTSIGYGNLVPISPFGRIFCICYAILGIPLTLITIADVAKFFADVLLNAPTKWQRWQRRRCIVASTVLPSPRQPPLCDANGYANNLNGGQNNNSDSDQLFHRHNFTTVINQTLTANEASSMVSARKTVRSNSGGGGWSSGRRMTLSDVEQRDRQRDQFRTRMDVKEDDACMEDNANEDDNDAVGVLVAPGFWTKASVLGLLLVYMSATAFAFTVIQESWNFLDAFYFCLITLVTIGFGDFCPVEEHHYGGWIVFIFVGLILSTLTVDLVGASTIESKLAELGIHTLGRGFDLSSFLTILGRGGDDSARLIQKFYAGAYQPADLKLIPYIDQTQQHASNNRTNSGVYMKSSKFLLPKARKHNAVTRSNQVGQNQTAENYYLSVMVEDSSFVRCKEGILSATLMNDYSSNNNDEWNGCQEAVNILDVEELQEQRHKQQIISVTRFNTNLYASKQQGF